MLKPYAKDGSTLDESCRYKRDGLFRVGPKGQHVTFSDLVEALDYMRKYNVNHWRRPSATTGAPGVVVAVRWA